MAKSVCNQKDECHTTSHKHSSASKILRIKGLPNAVTDKIPTASQKSHIAVVVYGLRIVKVSRRFKNKRLTSRESMNRKLYDDNFLRDLL